MQVLLQLSLASGFIEAAQQVDLSMPEVASRHIYMLLLAWWQRVYRFGCLVSQQLHVILWLQPEQVWSFFKVHNFRCFV